MNNTETKVRNGEAKLGDMIAYASPIQVSLNDDRRVIVKGGVIKTSRLKEIIACRAYEMPTEYVLYLQDGAMVDAENGILVRE